MTRWWRWAGAVALLALAAGCARPSAPAGQPSSAPSQSAAQPQAPAPQPIKARVAVSGVSINFLPYYIAEKQGFLKQEGLDVQTVVLDGGTLTVQSYLAGEVDIAVTSSFEPIGANLEGADFKIVSTFVPYMPHILMTRPEIKTGADLKGKKVGVSRLGAESHKAAQVAVQRLGLKPDDAVYIQAGNQTQRVSALIAGSIDATVVSPPGTGKLKKQGYNALVDLIAERIETAHENVVARDKVIRENPELVRRFLRGMVRALHYWHTNPEGTKKLMAEYLKLDPAADKDDIDDAYESYRKYQIPRAPYPSINGIKTQLSYLADAKKDPAIAQKDPNAFADPRFIKELEDGGFIRQLYGGGY